MQKLFDLINTSLELLGDHNYLKALVVFVVAFTLARLTSLLLSKVIGGLVNRSNYQLHESVTSLLRAPLYWTVIGIGFLVALELLDIPAKLDLIVSAILFSGLLLTWSTFTMRITRSILLHMSRRHGVGLVVRQHTLPLFNNIALIAVLALAVYLLFHIWNIDMTAWLASAGIVGIAVGFAAKDTLANLFAGAYGTDIDLVRKVLMGVAQANERVFRDPEHKVRFRSFGPSALEFELLCWIEDPELRGRVIDALNCDIYQEFLANKIEIPYSKHDVYIKGWMPPPRANL